MTAGKEGGEEQSRCCIILMGHLLISQTFDSETTLEVEN